MPHANRFHSAENGAGFKPLGDFVHSLGLKFGIHIARGIPRQAVAENLRFPVRITMPPMRLTNPTRVPGTATTSASSPRPGQACYNSIAQLYASWESISSRLIALRRILITAMRSA